jgi:hypothetical protein
MKFYKQSDYEKSVNLIQNVFKSDMTKYDDMMI